MPRIIFIKMNEKMINKFIHIKNIKHLKFKMKIFSQKIVSIYAVSKYADFLNFIFDNFGTFFFIRILLHLFLFCHCTLKFCLKTTTLVKLHVNK
jgi:hypothetical protein